MGEFTRHAFEGGRLDLTQAKGLLGLVDTQTEMPWRAALRVTGVGKPGSPANAMRIYVVLTRQVAG